MIEISPYIEQSALGHPTAIAGLFVVCWIH